jgi:glycerol-3-phosphate acyltransferase PlsY
MLYFWILWVRYIFGSVPFGTLIAKAKDIDVLCEGNGNPATTNVKRFLGKNMDI